MADPFAEASTLRSRYGGDDDLPRDRLIEFIDSYFHAISFGMMPRDTFTRHWAPGLRKQYMHRETERVQSLNTPGEILDYETGSASWWRGGVLSPRRSGFGQ